MAKRGNGEGSISRRKSDGLYMARYTVQTATGAKRKTIYGKTRGEVSEKLTKAMADRDGGLVFDAGSLTVGEYLTRWLEDCVRGTVRQRTYEGYEHVVNKHLKPAGSLGRLKLKSLTATHIRALYRLKLDGIPAEDVRALSPRSVEYIHVTLRKALAQAVTDGLVPRNVADTVKPPRPTKPEIQPLTPEEAKRLLHAAHEVGDRYEALYVLALHCGLRQGELLGLRWQDVDLESSAPALQVRRTLSQARSGQRFESPKSGKGRRVKLTRAATSVLKAHRKRQLEERIKLAGLYEDRGLVFANEIGATVNPSNLRQRSLAKLLKLAGLPKTTRFHDLRHTCATTLLKMGQHPKYVQELLGHANISITLDTYSHVLPGMGDGLADAMDDALG